MITYTGELKVAMKEFNEHFHMEVPIHNLPSDITEVDIMDVIYRSINNDSNLFPMYFGV
jgi:hypothetical protein